jgi:putative FmdB family regulatory protein
MPIYEYRCAACGHEIEALQKLSDAPLTECPSCHKPELKKLLSAAGFQLKGSGWYATDFRNSGAKPAAKDKAASKSASGDGSGATSSTNGESGSATDTKAAEKPATTASSESKPSAPASTPKGDSQ